MALLTIDRPSPNHEPRAAGLPVDILLLHYTGMKTAEEALARLTDPASKVSAHYTVDEDGTTYRHVEEARRAWHAGASSWDGASDINGRSIGIEIVNPGHEFGYREFPDAQIRAVIELAQGILSRHPIPQARVLGHSDVAPARKQDPGERFPWERLAGAGIGLWPPAGPAAPGPDLEEGAGGAAVEALQKDLARFGYGIASTGRYDGDTALVIAAFQRHFRPAAVTGVADGETRGRLARLLRLLMHP